MVAIHADAQAVSVAGIALIQKYRTKASNYFLKMVMN
jgi:hypothetical protein